MKHSARPLALALLTALLFSACSNDQAKVRDHLQRGDAAFAQRDYAKAIIEYRNAVKLEPNSGPTRARLGEAYLGDREPIKALDEYVRAADLQPEDTKLQLTVARLLSLGGDFESAIDRCAKVLAREPRNVEALILRGQFQLGLKDPDAAVAEIEQAISIDPTQSRAYTALGALELAKGRQEEAEKAFRRALELEPRSVPAHVAMGYFYWAAQRADDAERSFLDALELGPRNITAHQALATLYSTLNRPAESEPHLKAIAEASVEPEPRLKLADFYLEQNRLQEATAILTALTADDRIGGRAQERLALVAFRKGNRGEANRIVDAMLVRSPYNTDALLTKSRFLIIENRPDDAIDRLKTVVDNDPRSALGYFMLGGLYAQKNRADEALTATLEASKLNPHAVPVLLQAGQLYLATGDIANAKHMAVAALAVQPFNPDAHLVRAQALIADGDIREADIVLTSLARRYPESTTVQTQLGRIAEQTKDTAAATRYYQRALALNQDNRAALGLLAAMYSRSGRAADARRLVESRLQKSPDDPALLMLMAGAYAAESNVAGAESALKRVIGLDASNLTAYGMLGGLYIRTGRLEQALKEFQAAAGKTTQSPAAMTMIGLILETQGKPEEAIQMYERVVELDPRAFVAANNLASLYVDKDRNLEVALGLAQSARSGAPSNAAFADTLGWVHYARHTETLGLPFLKEAVAGDPRNPLHHYHLGMTYLRVGDIANARQSLERALRLNAAFPGADKARAGLATLK